MIVIWKILMLTQPSLTTQKIDLLFNYLPNKFLLFKMRMNSSENLYRNTLNFD